MALKREKMKQDEERRCIVSGEVKAKEELLRFTVMPDNQVIPDFKKKLPGRGIYVTNSKKALQVAVDKNLFAKACKGKAKADKQLPELVEGLLKKKGLEAVSLAKKAGVLVTGFEKVKDALKKDKIAFILEAKDAGTDGHEKMLALAKNLETFVLYDVEELDKALDRVNTVHAAFLKSEMSKMVHNEFIRLQAFLNS